MVRHYNRLLRKVVGNIPGGVEEVSYLALGDGSVV